MRFFEASSTKFSFVSRPEYPLEGSIDEGAVQTHWQGIIAHKEGQFNGQIYCCNGIVAEADGHVTFGFNRSDYSTYQYVRDHKLVTNGAYAAGDATVIYVASDDSYPFVKRSNDKVSYDGGKYSIGSGGVLSAPNYPVADERFLDYVSAHAASETAEELVTTGLQEAILLGLYLDEQTNKLEFLFGAIATQCLLNAAEQENVELIKVKRGSIVDFYHDNYDNLEASTKTHLSHWASKLDKGIFPSSV